MEQLTLIQGKISRNRDRRGRALVNLKMKGMSGPGCGQANSNSAIGRLVLSTLKTKTRSESEEQILARIFSKGGWAVRRHVNDMNFTPALLHSRHVVFTVRDDSGALHEYSGRLEAFSQRAGALFRLAGSAEVFNANLVSFMAVQAV